MFVTSHGSTLLALLHLDHVGTCLGKVLLVLQHLANFNMVLGSFLLAFQHLADVGTCLGGALLARNHLANFGKVLGSYLLPLSPLPILSQCLFEYKHVALPCSKNVLAFFEPLSFINYKSKYATMSFFGLMPCFLHIISKRGSIPIFATETMMLTSVSEISMRVARITLADSDWMVSDFSHNTIYRIFCVVFHD